MKNRQTNKRIILCIVAGILMTIAGYIVSHPVYKSYDQRYKAGNCFLGTGRYEEAIEAYEKAREFTVMDRDALAGLSVAYSTIGEREKAEELKKAATANGVISETVYDNMLVHYRRLKNNGYADVVYTDKYAHDAEYYDVNGRKVKSVAKNLSHNYEITTEYNSKGKAVKDEIRETWYTNVCQYTREYIYNDKGQLVKRQETKDSGKGLGSYEDYFYTPDGNLEKIEYHHWDSDARKHRISKVEYYKDGYLYQLDSYIRDDYVQDSLWSRDYYDKNGLVIKHINTYTDTGEESSYTLFTYTDTPQQYTETAQLYLTGDVLYTETVTDITHTDKTVTTRLYNREGEVVKTTVKTADGTKVERLWDDMADARPLTEEEINLLNTQYNDLVYMAGYYEIPQDKNIGEFIDDLPADDVLNYEDREELAVLYKEWPELKLNLGGVEYDIYKKKKVYEDTIEKLMGKYMGISLWELNISYYINYSPTYRSFYDTSTESNYGIKYRKDNPLQLNCLGGLVSENLRKVYTEEYTMVFRKTGNRWRLVACYTEDHTDLLPPQQETVQPPAVTPQHDNKVERIKTVFVSTDPAKGQKYNAAMKAYNEYVAQQAANKDYIYGKETNWKSTYRYALYDITGDGIPELFDYYGAMIPISVHTYVNGQVQQLDDSFSIYESKLLSSGYSCNRHSSTAISYSFTKYNRDSSTENFHFSHGWGSGDEEKFWINGEEVTKEEYMEFSRPYLIEYENSGVGLDFDDIYEYADIKNRFIQPQPSKGKLYNTVMEAYNEKIYNEIYVTYPDVVNPSYALHDVTSDGIPELFLRVNDGGIHNTIYTYKNGRLVEIPAYMGNGMHGPYYIYPQNIIIYYHSTTGVTVFVTEIYKDGTSKEVTFFRGMTAEPEDDIYFYNEKSVTMEEHDRLWAKYRHLSDYPDIKLDFHFVEDIIVVPRTE